MPDAVKALIDGFDKVTDILNVGRLLFYTVAGFCAVLPLAMCLILLVNGHPQDDYWVQFVSDFSKASHHYEVWIAALVGGFVISVVANALVSPEHPALADPRKSDFAYQYPRLYSGGMHLKDPSGKDTNTTKDYAAWLISEYYRYYEIAVFIPFGVLLSLPVYSLYSFAYLVRTLAVDRPSAFCAAYLAFPAWVFLSVAAWTVIWHDFWVPKIVQDTFTGWITAKRNVIAGLTDFIGSSDAPAPQTGPAKTDAAAAAKG